jgi:probable F420-dependent oxidoreductase
VNGRRFRFGLLVSRAGSANEWCDLARKSEELGYSTLLIADHFGAQLAPMPAAVAAAAATSSLRVGTFVLDNDFRHPAAVAKEAATVDVLSEGRFELGIGAGWNPVDYQMTGIPFEPPSVRVSRLAEGLQIISGFLGGERVTFQGQFYSVNDLEPEPRPVQRPRPPILIGANGPRMLRLAARYADIVNFPDRPPVGVSTAGNPGLGISFPNQLAVLREAAGPRFPQLELSVLCIPRVTDRVTETIDGLAAQMRTSREIVAEMPSTLIGSIDAIIEKLVRNRDQFGLSYAVMPASALDAISPVVGRLAGR